MITGKDKKYAKLLYDLGFKLQQENRGSIGCHLHAVTLLQMALSGHHTLYTTSVVHKVRGQAFI